MVSKKKFDFKTPILYLAFNRLDLVKRTFPEIKKIKPKELYISVDGPRDKREKKKTDEVRKYILKQIDWDCKVETLFPKSNLGCKVAVSRAIDWFFDNVKMGIVLEDDCLPSQDFFRYCQDLLEKYENDERLASICGTNPINIRGKESYGFVNTIALWGWASWRRSWKKIYHNEEEYMKKMESKKYLKETFPNIIERVYFGKKYIDAINDKVNTWEFPWHLGIFRSGGLNAIPKVNLVENIGIDDGFTNTAPNLTDEKFLVLKREKMNFPLRHPGKIRRNNLIRWMLTYRDYKRVIMKKLNVLFS